MSLIRALATSAFFASVALSQSICPLAGAVYPAPSQFSQSDAFAEANKTFNDELVRAFKSDSIYGALTYNASFSIDIYSLHEQKSLLTQHFSAPQFPSESGVKKVDSDTIYRLGSISKLLTTYIYLVNAGFEGWDDPITKYVPEFQQYADKSKANPIDVVAWDEVTVRALVSHLSGITRDGSPPPSTDAMLAAAGLPKVPSVPGDFCGDPAVQEFPCDDESEYRDGRHMNHADSWQTSLRIFFSVIRSYQRLLLPQSTPMPLGGWLRWPWRRSPTNRSPRFSTRRL